MPMMFDRSLVDDLARAVGEKPRLLQVVVGPRQVGKTTAAESVVRRLGWPSVVEAADFYPAPGPEWIETHWERARRPRGQKSLLVLDEIQKVRGWSETVKRLWDAGRRRRENLAVILLGSSSLLLQRGLQESLAGRFYLHRCMHWTFPECEKCFGWDLDRWIFFGGYPGAAPLVRREQKWSTYIADSLVETAIARDVLQLQTVQKPALLRSLFGLAAARPAQILSYNKMLGQLLDAGNTTTLAHYLDLLATAFLASGLPLYSAGQMRRRGSSPKLILWNNALVNAFAGRSLRSAKLDTAWWGRLVENAVGAHLLNSLPAPRYSISYWRDGDRETDFVVASGRSVWAVEVKSGRPGKASALAAFRARYPKSAALLVGTGGIPLEEFFSRPAEAWFPVGD